MLEIILALIILSIGIFIGYYIRGDSKKPPPSNYDYKNYKSHVNFSPKNTTQKKSNNLKLIKGDKND